MKNILAFILLISLPAWGAEVLPIPPKIDCKSAREFITTFEFLRTKKDLNFNHDMSRTVADKVAQGCTGAAKRFISSFEFLMRAELGTRNAIEISIELSQKSDSYAETFKNIFTKAYLAEYLDMDLTTSLQLARSLSTDFKGKVEYANKDFNELVEFCMGPTKMNLPPPRCGIIAARISKIGENFNDRMAPGFKKVFDFLREQKEVQGSVGEYLSLAEEVVSHSPYAADNFILAYKYGLQNNGLDLPAAKSLEFAKTIASHTKEQPYTPWTAPESNRLPAESKKTAPTPSQE